MSLYLNKNNDKFKEYKSARIFIDKSNLITNLCASLVLVVLEKQWPYLCLMLIILKAVILIFI